MKIGNLEVYGVIYKITNKINGKCYIGQTTNKKGFDGRYNCVGNGIERVYNYHLRYKLKGRAYNDHLLRSIHKYGFYNFEVVKVLDFAFSKSELNIKEQVYITLYNSFNFGYNNTFGGFGTKNLTSYNADKVVAFGDGFEFEFVSKKKGAEFFNIASDVNIGECCRENTTYSGKYNGKRIIWRLYNDYIKLTDLEKLKLIDTANHSKVTNNHNNKSVCVIRENERFEFINILTACKWFVKIGLTNTISAAKSGIQKCLKQEIHIYKGCLIKSI